MSEICPRCNQLGTRFVREINGRRYIYFRHYDYESGREKHCYIGPADKYEYVGPLHELNLKNILDQDYIDIAIKSLIKAAERLSRESKDIDSEKALEIVLRRLFSYLSEKHRNVLCKVLKELNVD